MSLDKLQLSTVKIETNNSTGTGFFIGSNHILTCGHVVASSLDDISFTWRGERRNWKCSIKEFHDRDDDETLSWLDIAILEIDFQKSLNTPPPSIDLELDDPEPGDKIYTFGYPSADYSQPNEGEASFLIYEGPYYEKEWGNTAYKLKDSDIQPGMSGSPLYRKHVDRVCGIVQLSRQFGGARGLAVSTLVKYVPYILEINKIAKRQQKIWFEFPKIRPADINLNKKISKRLPMIYFLGINAFSHYMLSKMIVWNQYSDCQLPHRVAIRLISCSHSIHKISEEINNVLSELDDKFRRNFGRRQDFEDLSIEIQTYMLITNFIANFSCKRTDSYGRILDILDTSRQRYDFLDQNLDSETDLVPIVSKKLVFWDRKEIFRKSKQKLLSNLSGLGLQAEVVQFSKLNDILQQLYSLREVDSSIHEKQWTELVQLKVNDFITENLVTLSWVEISLLKKVELLLCEKFFQTQKENYHLYAEISQYCGLIDPNTTTYHWNDSCFHLDKLKWLLMGQIIRVRRGEASDVTIRGVGLKEHQAILDNYEAHQLKKCGICHKNKA